MSRCFFWAGEILRGVLVIPICAPFCVKSPEGSPPFFRGEDFLGFFPEFFPGAITTATATPTAIATVITLTVIITTVAIAIGGTLIKVKVFPFGEIFQKVSSSISL